MAEKLDPKELVTFKELLTANSIMVETLTKLLLKKGIITNEEYFTTLKEVQMDYKRRE